MLIFNRFAFVHIPKTGGSFVRAVLQRHMRQSLIYETPADVKWGHETFDDLPTDYPYPVLAFVRNPWDWYVSWYFFMLQNQAHLVPPSSEQAEFFDAVFDGGRNNFASALTVLCEQQPPHPYAAIRRSMAEGHDFYSAVLVDAMGSGLSSAQLAVGRFETLRDDLSSFICAVGVTEQKAVVETTRTLPPVRAGERGDYRSYYTDTLHDMVRERAKWTIDRYGY